MSVCKACGKENKGHYKFCLGCGAELAAADTPAAAGAPATPAPAAPAKEAARSSTTAKPPRALSDTEPQGGPPTDPNMAVVTDDAVAPPAAAARPSGKSSAAAPKASAPASAGAGTAGAQRERPKEAPNQRAAGAENGQPVKVAPSLKEAQEASRPASARPCPQCGAVVPAGFAFCGQCGARLGADAAPAAAVGKTMFLGQAPVTAQGPSGRLVLIRPDGSEGGTHALKQGKNLIGRGQGPLFAVDGYLSPSHAELVLEAGGAVVRDTGSLNGVFVKLVKEEELEDGDVFRIGQELLRFDVISAPEPLEDGTHIMGSPNPGYWGRLSLVVGKDLEGSAFPLLGDTVVLGRERGDILFPEDGYVSGTHARISMRDSRAYLSDLNSSNGTFLRIRTEQPVPAGGFLLLGQQLFRLTLT